MSQDSFKWLTWATGLSFLVAVVWAGYAYLSLPGKPVAPDAERTTPLSWPVTDLPTMEEWMAFRAMQVKPLSAGPLAERFRLAGTFFVFGASAEDPNSGRSAIMDDLQKQSQVLVSEGDRVEDIEILQIHQDRVVVSQDGRQEELWLSYADQSETKEPRATKAPAKDGSETETVLETNRFGKRVGESRWVFKDEALREYYEEIMQDPERLASLFLSLKPDYQEEELAGYYLDMEGEQDFFGAIGLQNGDVVRRVNSMRMVSQARAEYFIKEFVQGRLGAVVLDIERAGEASKKIYLIR